MSREEAERLCQLWIDTRFQFLEYLPELPLPTKQDVRDWIQSDDQKNGRESTLAEDRNLINNFGQHMTAPLLQESSNSEAIFPVKFSADSHVYHINMRSTAEEANKFISHFWNKIDDLKVKEKQFPGYILSLISNSRWRGWQDIDGVTVDNCLIGVSSKTKPKGPVFTPTITGSSIYGPPSRVTLRQSPESIAFEAGCNLYFVQVNGYFLQKSHEQVKAWVTHDHINSYNILKVLSCHSSERVSAWLRHRKTGDLYLPNSRDVVPSTKVCEN